MIELFVSSGVRAADTPLGIPLDATGNCLIGLPFLLVHRINALVDEIPEAATTPSRSRSKASAPIAWSYGARVDVTVNPPHAPLRQIYRTVGYGSSFGGNPLRQHIGIGQADRVAEINVTWPTTGICRSLYDIAADRSYKLREGDGKLTQLIFR